MRRGAICLLAAVLAGCAVTPPMAPLPGPAEVARFEEWTASGRMALAADGEGGSGSFTWRQQGVSTYLSIRGPFGAGGLQVTADDQSMSVTDGSGRTVDTEKAREALRTQLGADLPWAHLRFWMLGVPAPGEPAEVADAAVPRRVIEQGGWRIGYDTFRPVSGSALPERFTATRGRVRLKVVIDDWAVAPEAAARP